VLLAEDNAVNQAIAKAMLDDIGCEVTVVGNGLLALEAVSREAFDIVLMDCEMPELDGFGATERIRALERDPPADVASGLGRARLPIVAVTALAMDDARDRCIEAGMDDYLTKPFSLENLVEMIEKWFEPGDAAASRRIERAAAVDDAPPWVEATSSEPATAQTGISGASDSDESDANDESIDHSVLAELDSIPGASESGLVSRVIALYMESSYPVGAVIREAVYASDAKGIATSAHKLKSSSFEVGAMKLGNLCKKLEMIGRSESIGEAESVAAELVSELERVREALEAKIR
jgi:CheY-like chemotaxis protein/HPt (histidine-containing phosphotransfer) domain-containing protein